MKAFDLTKKAVRNFWFVIGITASALALMSAIFALAAPSFARTLFFAALKMWAFGVVPIALILIAASLPRFLRNLFSGHARRGICAAALVCVMLFSLGCAGSPGPGQTQQTSPVTIDQIAQVEQYVKSIQWIMPLAGGVVAIFFPEALPAYQMAVASYNALIAEADQMIAQAKGDPTGVDPAKTADILAKLKDAFLNLDGAYKGQQPKTAT